MEWIKSWFTVPVEWKRHEELCEKFEDGLSYVGSTVDCLACDVKELKRQLEIVKGHMVALQADMKEQRKWSELEATATRGILQGLTNQFVELKKKLDKPSAGIEKEALPAKGTPRVVKIKEFDGRLKDSAVRKAVRAVQAKRPGVKAERQHELLGKNTGHIVRVEDMPKKKRSKPGPKVETRMLEHLKIYEGYLTSKEAFIWRMRVYDKRSYREMGESCECSGRTAGHLFGKIARKLQGYHDKRTVVKGRNADHTGKAYNKVTTKVQPQGPFCKNL